MKRTLLVLCTLLLVRPAVTGQAVESNKRVPPPSPKSTWQRVTVKGENFSVELPTLPAMTSSVALYPRLQKYRMERHLNTSLDGVVYTVDVFENPEPGVSLEDFIAEQNMASSFDLVAERDLSIDGVRGKEYSLRDKIGTVQFFADKRRLYRFAASGSLAGNTAPQQFFSSIALSKRKQATEVVDGSGMPLVLDTGERIYKGKEVDTKMRLISKPEPQYTEQARKHKIRGRVVLYAIFSKTGEVTNLQIVERLPDGLTEQCIDAARQIKFVPAIKDGQTVSMWITLEYYFNL